MGFFPRRKTQFRKAFGADCFPQPGPQEKDLGGEEEEKDEEEQKVLKSSDEFQSWKRNKSMSVIRERTDRERTEEGAEQN